jgi:hypothetical protein
VGAASTHDDLGCDGEPRPYEASVPAPPEGTGRASALERALATLVSRSTHAAPERLVDVLRAAGAELGARDVRVLLVDLDQDRLRPIDGAAGGAAALAVDATVAGRAFRDEAPCWEQGRGGATLWLPILDSADRLGVLGIELAAEDPDVVAAWELVAGLTGELVVSKDRYGDRLALARRSRDLSLAAEIRWSLLPPLTFTSPEVIVTGILEPAYEIAGDTFDYAVAAGEVHVGLFDAMGHGLEASRMASLAVLAYRHARRAGRPLDDLHQAIDATVAEEFGEYRFVTAQLCRPRPSPAACTC